VKMIQKYPITMVGSQIHLKLPKGSKVILAGPDEHNEECIWAEFEAKQVNNLLPRTLEIFSDGHLVPPLSTHVTSFRSANAMWHIYDHGEVLPAIGKH
jgi:hypothetical protein